MNKMNLSAKRLQIDKANSAMTLIVAGAVFILVFSLIAAKALLDQRAYQSRIITKKEAAVKQLQDNIEAVDSLKISYAEFVETPENAIGGMSQGNGERDGDNAKITLDALPSKYDFPALATSLEKLMSQNNMQIVAIDGNDAELERIASQDETPVPFEMPYSISVEGTYDPMYDLIKVFERSIRPMQIQVVKFTAGTDGRVQMDIDAQTYYMSEKVLNIKTEVVQ
jgi:hypothetical protein